MNLYQIKTTAYDEEDMLLVSDAPDVAIVRILEPMIHAERHEDKWLVHDDYLRAFQTALPQYQFFYYTEPHVIEL
jgi:hypothetical protein